MLPSRRSATLLCTAALAGVALAQTSPRPAPASPAAPTSSDPATSAPPRLAADPSGSRARLVWGELDGDGAPDLLVLSPAGALTLLRNAGPAGFEDVTAASGLAGVRGASAALWTDLDRDARADLLVVVPRGESRLFLAQSGAFADAGLASGLPLAPGLLAAELAALDDDGLADLRLVTAERDALWRNLGGGLFEPLPLELPRGVPLGPDGVPLSAGASEEGAASTALSGPFEEAGDPLLLCAATLNDALLGGCMQGSAVPTLGMLYPLSADLFVSMTGNVGVGTTSPGEKLDVAGDVRASGQLVSTAPSGAPLVVSSTSVVTNLNADRLDGLDAAAFSQLGGSIGTGELEDASVTAVKIAANAVNATHIATNGVGSSEIVDGTIVNADVSTLASIAGTKIAPDFGTQTVQSTGAGSFGSTAFFGGSVAGRGANGPTSGFLGVTTTGDDFDGVASADWNGYEIGVAGISTGASTTDNYGVIGHATQAGVRGENAGAPATDYAELGLVGLGLRAAGSSLAGHFLGNVDVDGLQTIEGGNATLTTLTVENPLNGGAGHFRTVDSPGTFVNATLIAANEAEGGALLATQSNAAATQPAAFITSNSTSSINRALHVARNSASAGDVAFLDANNTSNTGYVLSVRQRGTGTAVHIDKTTDSGTILDAGNGGDIEFRVDSTGNVFCDGAFTGGGADYAEWLERLDPREAFRPGDVVGVHGGRISKRLAGASQILVISSNPAVLANAPAAEEDVRDGFEKVAFLGQVPALVVGPVREGDLLVPSGLDDGSARAVPPHALAAGQVGRVLGTAWESSPEAGARLVLAAVGIDQARAAAAALEAAHVRLAGVEARLARQEDALARLAARVEASAR